MNNIQRYQYLLQILRTFLTFFQIDLLVKLSVFFFWRANEMQIIHEKYNAKISSGPEIWKNVYLSPRKLFKILSSCKKGQVINF